MGLAFALSILTLLLETVFLVENTTLSPKLATSEQLVSVESASSELLNGENPFEHFTARRHIGLENTFLRLHFSGENCRKSRNDSCSGPLWAEVNLFERIVIEVCSELF
jgi:hypothetical protein